MVSNEVEMGIPVAIFESANGGICVCIHICIFLQIYIYIYKHKH